MLVRDAVTVKQERGPALPHVVAQEDQLVPAPPSSESDDDGYLSGIRLWVITLGLMLGVFVMALDNNILGWSLPE